MPLLEAVGRYMREHPILLSLGVIGGIVAGSQIHWYKTHPVQHIHAIVRSIEPYNVGGVSRLGTIIVPTPYGIKVNVEGSDEPIIFSFYDWHGSKINVGSPVKLRVRASSSSDLLAEGSLKGLSIDDHVENPQ